MAGDLAAWLARQVITAREIGPSDEPLFDAWYAALREAVTADRPAAMVVSHQALSYSLRNPGTLKSRLPVAAFDGGRLVGTMLFEFRLLDNLDAVEVEIGVPPAERRRGGGTALWDWAKTRAAAEGRTIFQTEISVPAGFTAESWPGSIFAAKLGFSIENVEDHLAVPLPYNEGLLQQIRQETPPLDGYRLTSWAGQCPEEHLQEYADLRTAMARDAPTGGMTTDSTVWDVERLRENEERTDVNYLALVTMAHTVDGHPAGYTLIYLPRTDPDHVQQDDTLVLRKHRGRHLGTQLKLANLDQLAKHRVDQRWLHTWTADNNDAMRKVNARFGFRAVEQLHECELTIASHPDARRPRLRPAARGVVLDRVLLMRFEFSDGTRLWATPGGGIEPGESVQEGLVRELSEEVGLQPPADPPHLWHQEVVADGHAVGYDGVINDYFLIRVDSLTANGTMSDEELRAECVYGHRWWILEELLAHQGPELLAPRALPQLLQDLLQHGPPAEPIQLGL